MRSVFSMEPEGITRAWPIVPLISKKTSATQNQAMISCCTFWPTGTLRGCSSLLRFGSDFMFHRHGMFHRALLGSAVGRALRLSRAIADFQLHQVRRIDAGVAGRAVVALRIVYRLL